MRSQTLVLDIRNLSNNHVYPVLITASNPYMLLWKVTNFLTRDTWVNSWSLTNARWEAGNSGINAEAYLWETIDELQS